MLAWEDDRRAMPTNLPPEYYDVEERYRAATTPEEKAALLEEMLSTIPKHKGTDHLRADLRRKLAQLKGSEHLTWRLQGCPQHGPMLPIGRKCSAPEELPGFNGFVAPPDLCYSRVTSMKGGALRNGPSAYGIRHSPIQRVRFVSAQRLSLCAS